MNNKRLSYNLFEYIPTAKTKQWIINAMSYRFNIAEGTIRSGKDCMGAVAFTERILISSGDLFLIGAVSVDRAMAIVGKYIINYFNTEYHELGFAVKCLYNNTDAICINYKGKNKYIIFSGGYQCNSQDAIQGLSLYGVYLTEINLLNADFIAQCIKRFASAVDGFLIGTLNPKGQNHYFYKDFLRIWFNEQENMKDRKWLNYDRFKLSDNPIMTAEMIEDAMKGYDPDSLLYKRDILGLRVDAEGLIYKVNKDKNIIKEKASEYIRYCCIADFGETISATYFGCYGLHYNKETKHIEMQPIKEYHHINGKATMINFKYTDDYIQDFCYFIKDCIQELGQYPDYIGYDGSTEVYYKLLSAFEKNNLDLVPRYVTKDDINDRIKIVQNLLYSGRLKINECCEHLINDLGNAMYDQKVYDKTGQLVRVKDFTTDGHLDALDSLEYAVTFYKYDLSRD